MLAKVIFSLIFVSLASGCTSMSKYKVKQPFLYSVSKNNQVEAYLFGTIHIGVTSEDFPDELWRYFDSASRYAFEADFEMDKESFYKELSQSSKSESSPRVGAYLSKFEMAQLHQILDKDGVSDLDDYTPLEVLSVLSKKTGDKNQVQVAHGEYVRLQTKFMLDDRLLKKAKASNKEILLLDRGTTSQLGKCLNRHQGEFANSVKEMLAGKNESNVDQINKILELANKYRDGDESFFKKSLNSPIFDECLIEVRNKIWQRHLKKTKANEVLFVSVGLAHIIYGPDSLIAFYEKNGFKVNRVRFDQP